MVSFVLSLPSLSPSLYSSPCHSSRLSPFLFLPVCLSLSPSFLSFFASLSLSLPLLSLSLHLTLSLSHTHTHSHTLSLCQSHTLSLSACLSLGLCKTDSQNTHSLSLSATDSLFHYATSSKSVKLYIFCIFAINNQKLKPDCFDRVTRELRTRLAPYAQTLVTHTRCMLTQTLVSQIRPS